MSTLYTHTKAALKRWAHASVPVLHRCFGIRGTFFFLAFAVGLLAGAGAALLKFLIGRLTHLMTWGMAEDAVYWPLLVIPIAGFVLTGIVSRYIVREPMEHGCERLNRQMAKHVYRMKARLTVGPIVASTITLGCGGSAGSEGPIAYTGAAIGSNIGRMFSLSPNQMRILVGVGAGAGIAGIFKAPVGGILFAIEVMGLSVTTASVIALVIGCLTAGATAFALSGYTLDVAYHQTVGFHPSMYLPIFLLGVFCGLYSLWYSFCMSRSQKVIARMRNPWVRNVVSGAFIGVLLLMFPKMYGEGYGVDTHLINDNFTMLLDSSFFFGGNIWVVMGVVAGMLAVKAVAVQVTNSGGGVAGDFAPTLFAGALAGFLFATFSNTVFGTTLSVSDFAFFGMAATMAGTIQAPLMALFLTSEMTGDFSMLLPLMLSAAVSYGMVRFCNKRYSDIFRPVWRHHLRRN